MARNQALGSKKKLVVGFIVIILLLAVVLGSLFGFNYYVQSQKGKMRAQWKSKPIHITATQANKTDWQPTIEATGSADAIEATPISTQVSGLVDTISFDSGSWVKKGQVLFKLDTKQKQAELKKTKASLKLAKITYRRRQRLMKQNAISKQKRDEALAQYNEAKANVQAIKADINYHTVRAPFDGKIGLNELDQGQYFQQGDTAAILTKMSPIYIKFPVPQNHMSQIHTGDKIQFATDAYPGKTFTATINAFDSQINNKDRGLMVEATYPNRDNKHLIYPGMFVDVSVILPKKHGVIVLPRNAINYTLYGQSVYILKPVMKNGKHVTAKYSEVKNGKPQLVSTHKKAYKVKRVPIKTGSTQGNTVVVTGIDPGSLVVTSGQNKLQNGTRVVVDDSVQLN